MDPVRAAVIDAVAEAEGTIYVGFSGGRDSTVLLHAVAAGRRHDVVAVHVNHGLHGDADDWQHRCEGVAAGFGVAFLARGVSVARQGSLEARARAARYGVFAELLNVPSASLFLAHHQHDQSETVLLRLLQGRGLYGMPARRPLASGTVVRPLLDLAPGCLSRYAREHGLAWVDDPGNADQALDRNYLRHRVLPLLRRRWPDVDDSLVAAHEGQRLAELRLAASFGGLDQTATLSLSRLQDYSRAEAVELARLWLAARGFASPGRAALGELLRQALEAAEDRQPRLQLDGAEVRRHGRELHLVAPAPELAGCYPVSIPGLTSLPHGDLRVETDPAGFRPEGAVEVRFRRGGERLEVAGRHRSVKQLLQAAGVPPWERGGYPLLFDARGLLAVPGVAERVDAARAPGHGGHWRAVWHPRPHLVGDAG